MNASSSDRSVVVTGGTGYIGSRLVRSLAGSGSVAVTAREPASAASMFADIDIEVLPVGEKRPAQLLDDISPAVVFHLATQYERTDPDDVSPMVRSNFEFGVEILDAASRLDDCRVVLVGSHFQVPAPGRQPSNLYAATKEALLTVARYFQDARGLRWTQVVLYDVYGPDDPRDKLIPRVVASLKKGQKIRIPDPEPKHHFVFVDDVVDGMIVAAENLERDDQGVGESVFLTSAALTTPSDVVSTVANILGTAAEFDETPYVPPAHTIMVPTDGPRPAGWTPRVSLTDGIRRTIGSA